MEKDDKDEFPRIVIDKIVMVDILKPSKFSNINESAEFKEK